VLAFDDGLITFTLAVSSLLAGWAAEYVGVRTVMVGLAAVEFAFAIAWTIATRKAARLPVELPGAGPGRPGAPAPEA
jgi:hypothetical protein